jgi:hypothetical protein
VPPIIKTLCMSCVWTAILLIPCALTAQNAALHITVISGENTTHAAGAHVAKPITIEVTDLAGQPVEGARTSFQLPEEGPGGVLSSGLHTDLAVTDSHGRATLRGFQLNRQPGPFNVRVTVAKEQARAGIVVRQRIGEVSAATGSADRQAQPSAASAPAETVSTVKKTPPKAEPAKATPATVRPTRVATPTAIEANGQPAPASRKALTEPAASVAVPRPTRTQTIVITQKSPQTSGAPMASSGSKSHKKWIVLGILVAGGAAGAFARSSLGAASAAHNPGSAAGLNSSVSIGTPTITIGKP